MDPALLPAFLRSSLRLRHTAAITALATLPLVLSPLPPAEAATFTVSDANWGTSAITNSFAWALAQANGNLGADTISITPGLAIDVDGATPVPGGGGWLTTISDNLTIEGNGATLVGNPSFVSSGGSLYTKYNVDIYQGPPLGTDILTQQAFSFGKVAPGVSLSINALNSDGLNGYLQLREGSTASISQSAARNSVSYGYSAHPVFDALANSILNLKDMVLERLGRLSGQGEPPMWCRR